MNIFLTNDDGYLSYGILGLAEKLSEKHNVTVVAPHNPQSGAGHALTMHKPLRIKHFSDLSEKHQIAVYSCSGKPADCAKIGIDKVIKEKPDLVLSGINLGANLGTDVIYSGTVSGALEAAMMGYRAMAVSLDNYEGQHMDTAIRFIAEFIEKYPIDTMVKDYILNINVPAVAFEDIKGIKVASLGEVRYENDITVGIDPFGNDYYWIGGRKLLPLPGDKDVNFIKEGFVTVTPVSFMMGAEECIKLVEKKIERL